MCVPPWVEVGTQCQISSLSALRYYFCMFNMCGVYTSLFALCGHMCMHAGCVYMSFVHLRIVVDWDDFLNNLPF